MKYGVLVAIAIVGASFVSTPVYAKDSCASVLCLYGMFTGSGGGSACKKPLEDYFSIIKFGSFGQVLTGHTHSARGDYLSSCGDADSSTVKKVNDKYGRMIL